MLAPLYTAILLAQSAVGWGHHHAAKAGCCTVCGAQSTYAVVPSQQVVPTQQAFRAQQLWPAQGIVTGTVFVPTQATVLVRPPYKTQRQFVPLDLNAPVPAPLGGTEPELVTAPVTPPPVFTMPLDPAAAELPAVIPGTSPFSAAAPQPAVMIAQPFVVYPRPNFAHILLGDQ